MRALCAVPTSRSSLTHVLCLRVLLSHCAVPCRAAVQVRIVEAAKEKLQKDMRSNSSKNLAAMVSVQA